ncbi:Hypothetical protein NTJ_12936 [Nesidiocoris tenuis]|uniref:UPAR/Ly6 domain-containing protein n=1 Tax=Nesidiocoris tenuis TaxID=355587 RepID=A0ABN7B6V0_9HEMI|nr:Hypothetical protein NTJ_12936 [Nesidiocoris tenuis]
MFHSSVIVVALIFVVFDAGNAMECYVCKDQDGNNGKCLHTIMTCQAEEDQCMTEIKWGTMPYWQAGAKKQFYISKKCATKKMCEKTMKKTLPYCTHVWYEDWRCSECCGGDRCNYFIISGSPKAPAALFPILCGLGIVRLFGLNI